MPFLRFFIVLSFPGALYVFRLFRAPERTPSNLHQIAGVIGTGLFLGLGQLLPITGPLGVILVFLLVGSVAYASVLSIDPNSRSDIDIEAVYFVAPWCLLQKWLCLLRWFLVPSHITVCHL